MDEPVYIGEDVVKPLMNKPIITCTYRISLRVFNMLLLMDWERMTHRLQKPAPPYTEICLIQVTKTGDDPSKEKHVLCFGKRVVDELEVSTIAGRAPYDFPIIPVELEILYLDQYVTKEKKLRPSSTFYTLSVQAIDGFMEFHFPHLRLSSVEEKKKLWYRVYKDEGDPFNMRLSFL